MTSAVTNPDEDEYRSEIHKHYAEAATSADRQVYFYTGGDEARRASYSDSLIDVAGVGPATARRLSEAGFTSVVSIADAEWGALAVVGGIGPVRAESLQTAAQRLLAGGEPVSRAVTGDDPSIREERAKGLRKHAKQLRTRARKLSKKAGLTKSKKKRKRRLREAAKLEAAAKKARRKAKKLLAN